MLIVGELINTSRKGLQEAVKNRDRDYIQKLAARQVHAGATCIDVNAGTLFDDEPGSLRWLVETVQQVVDVPCCLDSPDPEALREALGVHRGKPLINSITDEKDRYEKILPLVLEYKTKVVALCMSDKGMPEGLEDRVSIAGRLVEKLTACGVSEDDIYIDPLVEPISVFTGNALTASEAIRQILFNHPAVHTICGLSNVSYGLPKRKLLNRAFLIQCMAAGLDGVILDPLDSDIMSLIYAANVLLNRDDYCLDYINAERGGKLKS